jgi:hypothetical protein
LLQREGIIERCDGDVAAVKDRSPAGVRVDVGSRVEAPEGGLSPRCSANGSWAEACTRSIAYCSIKGSAEYRNVEELRRVGEAANVREVGEGADT